MARPDRRDAFTRTGAVASASGGFWVLELAPQVRTYLELDEDEPDTWQPGDGKPPGVGDRGRPPHARPETRHPDGRPGTKGTARAATALDVDLTAYYCTLGNVAAALPSTTAATSPASLPSPRPPLAPLPSP